MAFGLFYPNFKVVVGYNFLFSLGGITMTYVIKKNRVQMNHGLWL